jgi:FkbM family methyltransferase
MILRRLKTKFYKWTERKIKADIDRTIPLIRPGTEYGGWIIPAQFLREDSVVYLVGAGEDVSFDLALADQFRCTVEIIDPTPRSERHIELLKQNIVAGVATPLITAPGGIYPKVSPSVAARLQFHPVGLWNEESTLRFYKPQNEAHVSHSLVNLQKTEEFIEVPVCRLSVLMQKLGHTKIDLLKVDIEGAEYVVLQTILEDNLDIRVICVEYDETASNHIDGNYINRIEDSIHQLRGSGYLLVAKEPSCRNYTFVHQRYFNESA